MQRKRGFYEKYIKRLLDIICSSLFILLFAWLYAIIAILVRWRLGKPVIFKQPRPGIKDEKTCKEKIFDMYKFRSMTDERGPDGEFLPDEKRLGRFGKFLRSTSLDELPELFNILKGEMSFVGPRPQLVRDMVFMTEEQRMRHTARPGLTGLAQINGRNAISWEEKFEWDLKYIEKVTFWKDVKIMLGTVATVFKRSGITDGANATVDDYGECLLKSGKISEEEFYEKNSYAKELLLQETGK